MEKYLWFFFFRFVRNERRRKVGRSRRERGKRSPCLLFWRKYRFIISLHRARPHGGGGEATDAAVWKFHEPLHPRDTSLISLADPPARLSCFITLLHPCALCTWTRQGASHMYDRNFRTYLPRPYILNVIVRLKIPGFLILVGTTHAGNLITRPKWLA